ncbi:Protein RDM1, plant [Dillenia turbinata]|uniref:Protein RDM1, plant n=1 Tax=Dillenia turbinata TaxID=194707 RepID=A0AAN8VFL4_9MAGN
MLKAYHPLSTKHLERSDSDTESDDMTTQHKIKSVKNDVNRIAKGKQKMNEKELQDAKVKAKQIAIGASSKAMIKIQDESERSDSDTESDDMTTRHTTKSAKSNVNKMVKGKQKMNKKELRDTKGKAKQITIGGSSKAMIEIQDEPDAFIKQAKIYQQKMKSIPIPTSREYEIFFETWQDLAQAMKSLYGQPLHYLTNVLLKQWDLSRIEIKGKKLSMDEIFDEREAEDLVWLVEEIHRFEGEIYVVLSYPPSPLSPSYLFFEKNDNMVLYPKRPKAALWVCQANSSSSTYQVEIESHTLPSPKLMNNIQHGAGANFREITRRVSEASEGTVLKVQQRRRRAKVSYTYEMFDATTPKYSWLPAGWVAEQRRIIDSGRLYTVILLHPTSS